VNARPRRLALYYFGGDNAERRRVLDRTTSGNVTINGTLLHIGQDDLPFGGVGESGMGKYHGIEGFRTLSHPKGIFVRGPLERHQPPPAAVREARRRPAELLPPLSAFANVSRQRPPAQKRIQNPCRTPPRHRARRAARARAARTPSR
jgi:hypothetical protein